MSCDGAADGPGLLIRVGYRCSREQQVRLGGWEKEAFLIHNGCMICDSPTVCCSLALLLRLFRPSHARCSGSHDARERAEKKGQEGERMGMLIERRVSHWSGQEGLRGSPPFVCNVSSQKRSSALVFRALPLFRSRLFSYRRPIWSRAGVKPFSLDGPSETQEGVVAVVA